MRVVDRAVVWVLAGVLLVSGIDKLFHYEGFTNALDNYVLVPLGWAPFLALPIIAVEILAGLGLLLPRWRSKAAGLAAVAITCFTLAIAVNYSVGERGICGCWFTVTLAKGTTTHILQNLLLIALAILICVESRKRTTRELVGVA